MPLMKTFSRPEISGWKPAPSSIERGNAAVHRHGTGRRLRDARHELEQRALARAVPADDAKRTPRRQRERHVPDRRKRLVRLQVAHEASRQQRALERGELPPAVVATVDLRRVGDFDGVHCDRLTGFGVLGTREFGMSSAPRRRANREPPSRRAPPSTPPPQTCRATGRTRSSRTGRRRSKSHPAGAAASNARPDRQRTGSPGTRWRGA